MLRHTCIVLASGVILTAGAVLPALAASTTERVSVGPGETQGNSLSAGAAISADGNVVAFVSDATNLVPGDSNGLRHVFVRDRRARSTERISVSATGIQANDFSSGPALSADGQLVVFISDATNLIVGDTNGKRDCFLRDRQARTTRRVSLGNGGLQPNGHCIEVRLSPGGRYAAFTSDADNLFPSDLNQRDDVFLRDLSTGRTELISRSRLGGPVTQGSFNPSVSANGRFVAFDSLAGNLVAGDTNGQVDVFVRDRATGRTARASVGAGGVQGRGRSFSGVISNDGRYVAFLSSAANLVAGDTNGVDDAFVRDMVAGTTIRVSVGPDGVQSEGSVGALAMAPGGRYIAFESHASNLVAGDTNGWQDVFVHDVIGGRTFMASRTSTGAQGDFDSFAPALAAGASVVAFSSLAANLVPGDTNGTYDVFVRLR